MSKQRIQFRVCIRRLFLIALTVALACHCLAQTAAQSAPAYSGKTAPRTSQPFAQQSARQSSQQSTSRLAPDNPFAKDLEKYPGLMQELAQLIEAMQKNVQFPDARSQSNLMPLLPATSTYYVALPNYGKAARETLDTLNQQLQSSSVLRDWWEHGELKTAGPKTQDFLAKFAELSEYLGDEIVLSGDTGSKGREIMLLAEVRKPGFKEYLRGLLTKLHSEITTPVLVLDAAELAQAKADSKQVVVLVRPDFVVVGENVEALRSFNTLLDAKSKDFASTPFGLKLAQAYQQGTSMVLAADLHTILKQIPNRTEQNDELLQRSGFSDVNFAVWQYKHSAGLTTSEMEVGFTGARRGVASWLAAPGPMGGLEFLAAKPAMAGDFLLKNFGEIYSDIKYLAAVTNPAAFAAVTPMEQSMHISLKDDLLDLLTGEVAFEVSDFSGTPAVPQWRSVFKVSDAEHVEKTLSTIFTAMKFRSMPFEEDGVTYHSVAVPTAANGTKIVYAFVDGYLIIGGGHDTVAEGIRLHKSGESLARSVKLQESSPLPAGLPAESSALFYEDPATATMLNLHRFFPGMAETFKRIEPPSPPITGRAYGEESSIRSVSTGGGAQASAVVLILAAIAIPNVMRARIAANESAAIATTGSIAIWQVTYRGLDIQRGYAPDLATLGRDAGKPGLPVVKYPGLSDSGLAGPECTAGTWCSKSGYRFTMKTECGASCSAKEFAVTATPETPSTGARSFCATDDGITRFKLGSLLAAPVSASECRKWQVVAE